MWKVIWIALLVAGMAGFVITALLVSIRAVPELISLLRQHLEDQEEDKP